MTGRGPGGSRFATRVIRHWRWARREGVGRLIEEDQLNPFERIPLAARKWWWRSRHDIAPMAVPVFLVGVQRSGTNMLVRGFETSPQFEVLNENDRRAFVRFRLRPAPVVKSLVERSGHRYVLFKPLADSHRVAELLQLGTPSPPRAIWAYRSVDGRVRSAVSKFGANNLLALRAIAEGTRGHGWSADAPAQEIVDLIREGLSTDSLELVRGLDYDELTAESGAALFWYVRNVLYFELRLHDRHDVILSSYDAMIRDPESTMRALCGFLGTPFHPGLVTHVRRHSRRARPPLELHPEIRRRCDELETRLDEAARQKLERFAA